MRAQVDAAKVVQRAVLARDAVSRVAGADGESQAAREQAKKRLESQLRPAIDRIDGEIRAALVAAAPLHTPVERLAAAMRADAAVAGFDAEQARLLARALARIPAAAPWQSANSS